MENETRPNTHRKEVFPGYVCSKVLWKTEKQLHFVANFDATGFRILNAFDGIIIQQIRQRGRVTRQRMFCRKGGVPAENNGLQFCTDGFIEVKNMLLPIRTRMLAPTSFKPR